jgi:peptidoglycan-associated lipoprotein
MLNKKLLIAAVALLASSCSSNATKSDTSKTAVKNESVTVTEIKKDEPTQNHTVFFDTAKYELTSDAVKVLDKNILPEIKDAKNIRVTIEGYCDERGTVGYNKRLGKNRADAVKSYLVKNGVKSSKIKTVTFGKSNPVDKGHDESAWEKNRRAVTITIERK